MAKKVKDQNKKETKYYSTDGDSYLVYKGNRLVDQRRVGSNISFGKIHPKNNETTVKGTKYRALKGKNQVRVYSYNNLGQLEGEYPFVFKKKTKK